MNPDKKNLKIVLSGGAGLVGQNLVARLKARGYQHIVVLDKHQANIAVLKKVQSDITVEYADLAEQGTWQDHIKDADVVIGFGGYVSAPAYLAAKMTRTPIVIHEANAKPGWANRLGSRFSQHLAVAHPVDSGRFENALLAGLPLRSDVSQAFIDSSTNWEQSRREAKVRLGFPIDTPLITTGSGMTPWAKLRGSSNTPPIGRRTLSRVATVTPPSST